MRMVPAPFGLFIVLESSIDMESESKSKIWDDDDDEEHHDDDDDNNDVAANNI